MQIDKKALVLSTLATLVIAPACGDDGDDQGATTSSTSSTSSATGGTSSSGGGSAAGGNATGGNGGDAVGGSGGGCPDGWEVCSGECIDTSTDVAHCGGCDSPCGGMNDMPVCAAGSCTLNCEAGYDSCDSDTATGCETNLATTPQHCGACMTTVAETCNGLDDDCNTIADNGCPMGATTSNNTLGTHPLYGNITGGTPFTDNCAVGSAIYRFSGYVGGNIDTLRAHCAPIEVTPDTSVMPYTYTVTRGADAVLATHGGNVTTPFDLSCPAGEFAVGIDAEASAGGVHELTMHCAGLIITENAGAYDLSYGTITQYTASGLNVGKTISDVLTAPKLVTMYRVRSGAWIDAIGIGEGDVTITLTP